MYVNKKLLDHSKTDRHIFFSRPHRYENSHRHL